MKILGISAFYHDSAASVTDNGKIIAAAQEERFTRKKHDSSFPVNACRYCLEYAGLKINELDAIAFYDKPFLKFERLLETYYAFAPKGLLSFVTSVPVWLKEKIFLKKLIFDELKKIDDFDKRKVRLLFPEHHLSHAASAFYPSPFREAAIVTVDGVGEWATASICSGSANKIKVIKELHFPHSVGLLYSSFTFWLGFRVNSGEYKLMGLAPYGNPGSERVKEYINKIKNELADIKEDGSVWLNQKYFNYSTGLKMVNEKKWEKLFGFPRRYPEGKLEQQHCDLAMAIQKVSEEIMINMAKEAKRLVNTENLCLAGGVALNCVANGKLLQLDIFKNIFIQPAAGDAGGAIGASLAAFYLYFNNERGKNNEQIMRDAYLGPEFSDLDIETTSKKLKARYTKYENFDDLSNKISELIEQGKVIGWFQGRMEFGPRALGNRSILGDARSREMQKKLNVKIKYRESFRPFAPSVLAEDTKDYFELSTDSPYMLLVANVNEERRNQIPPDYNNLPLLERLYFTRSDIPAVTHIDFSARIQTVHKDTNPRFWKLIDAFKRKTGTGLIVNTSFNVRGEPIVCTPEDAYRCFMRTEMDFLVMGNYLYDKQSQPSWPKDESWKKEFALD
jgi:carbamoyltransferase